MDPLQQKRPKRLAATKPKNYAPFQTARKSPPSLNARSPPNLNPRPAAASPRSPAVQTPEPMARQDEESVIHVEAEIHSNMADAPESPLTQPDTPQGLTPLNLEAFFKDATEKFQHTIQSAVNSFVAKLSELEENINASLEFERKRIDNLQEKQSCLETRMGNMEKELNEMKALVSKSNAATNKSERFSRRNNRMVGIKEAPQGQREECVEIVEEIMRENFGMTTKVERAHRDGRRMEGRPRHILIKFLSYREKVDVIRRAREILKDKSYFVVDDLTPADLEEKQKWVKQVQEMYKDGTKLRFYAGKWRQAGGVPFQFE